MRPLTTKPTWSGRIPGGLDPRAWEFLDSLPTDIVLAEDDVVGSIAHVRALEDAGLLSARDAKRLLTALQKLVVTPAPGDEDVHSVIERQLTEQLGELGGRVHTARSRNDQVATALRLYVRRAVADTLDAVLSLVEVLADRADASKTLLAPGYTHLQRAQPITLGHWLVAHAFAFERDAVRLVAAVEAADVSPLGAGALAGSTLGVDPAVPAAALGFARPFDNSLDVVADRDFFTDALYAHAMVATHLSRLAEEVVLWSTAEFGFLKLPDAFATGSSMMPQKKNPDVAELTRGESGTAVGALTALLHTLKGLPLAYDRDLQADKQHLRTLDRVRGSVRAMTGLMEEAVFDEARLAAAVSDPSLLATDVAEELVRRGVPFRRAHERVAAIARRAEDKGVDFRDAAEHEPPPPLTARDLATVLDLKRALGRRTTPGGPSPKSVGAQVRTIRRRTASHAQRLVGMRANFPTRASAARRGSA